MSVASLWGGSAPARTATSQRPRLAVVRDGARADRPAPLRLTRRGRLVLLAAAAVALVLVGAFVGRVSTADASAGRTVVVPAGSTLSEVAARELPDRPVAQGVADIQRANGLVSDQVRAGQVLSIPVG